MILTVRLNFKISMFRNNLISVVTDHIPSTGLAGLCIPPFLQPFDKKLASHVGVQKKGLPTNIVFEKYHLPALLQQLLGFGLLKLCRSFSVIFPFIHPYLHSESS